jgi:hypothetical protein
MRKVIVNEGAFGARHVDSLNTLSASLHRTHEHARNTSSFFYHVDESAKGGSRSPRAVKDLAALKASIVAIEQSLVDVYGDLAAYVARHGSGSD